MSISLSPSPGSRSLWKWMLVLLTYNCCCQLYLVPSAFASLAGLHQCIRFCKEMQFDASIIIIISRPSVWLHLFGWQTVTCCHWLWLVKLELENGFRYFFLFPYVYYICKMCMFAHVSIGALLCVNFCTYDIVLFSLTEFQSLFTLKDHMKGWGGEKNGVWWGGTHNLCRIETASYFWSVWMKPKFVILIVLCRKEFSFSGRELWWSEELEAWLTQDFSLPLPLSSCLESLLKSRKEWKQHFIRWHCILSSLIPNKSI